MGDDTSGSPYVYDPVLKYQVPSSTYASSLSYYADRFATYKLSSEADDTLEKAKLRIKYFSVVRKSSGYSPISCAGGQAFYGRRYIDMASRLGGQSYDLCSQPISSVLNSLSGQLQAQKLAFRTRYLFINHEPDLAKLRVVKYLNGDPAQAVEIPQDPANGWTYAGYLTDFAIDSPVKMNKTTGYAIELHGKAKLIGEDRAKVTSTPKGAQDSRSN